MSYSLAPEQPSQSPEELVGSWSDNRWLLSARWSLVFSAWNVHLWEEECHSTQTKSLIWVAKDVSGSSLMGFKVVCDWNDFCLLESSKKNKSLEDTNCRLAQMKKAPMFFLVGAFLSLNDVVTWSCWLMPVPGSATGTTNPPSSQPLWVLNLNVILNDWFETVN